MIIKLIKTGKKAKKRIAGSLSKKTKIVLKKKKKVEQAIVKKGKDFDKKSKSFEKKIKDLEKKGKTLEKKELQLLRKGKIFLLKKQDSTLFIPIILKSTERERSEF